MKISKVTLKDLKDISNIENSVFDKKAFSEDLIRKLIKKNFLFLKLEKNGIIKNMIGFVIVIKDRKDRANIINFLIDPKHQNRGHGAILLNKTIQKIKELNEIKSVILNVQVGNSVAIKLYQKFNFRISKKIEKYYQSKEDAFLMELEFI